MANKKLSKLSYALQIDAIALPLTYLVVDIVTKCVILQNSEFFS